MWHSSKILTSIVLLAIVIDGLEAASVLQNNEEKERVCGYAVSV